MRFKAVHKRGKTGFMFWFLYRWYGWNHFGIWVYTGYLDCDIDVVKTMAKQIRDKADSSIHNEITFEI